MARTKDKPALRIMRLEVRGVDRETRARWMALAGAIRRVTNDLRALWLAAHYAAGSHLAVRTWREADTAWAKTPKDQREPKQRAKCPVECWKLDGKDLAEGIRKQLTGFHPAMNSRCITLAVQRERQTMASAKGSNSAYPQWMLALCGDGEFRQSHGVLPIPFDRGNAKLLPPAANDSKSSWRIEMRVDRIPRDGTTAVSTLDRVAIYTGGRRLQSQRTLLGRIVDGELAWKGSALQFRDGQWYVLLSYTVPKAERADVDPAREAVLRLGRERPVELQLGDFTHWLRRQGRDIRHVRRSLLVQRWSRQSAYKDAGSGQKGHGRKKWQTKIGKLSRRWRDFVKTYNEQLARDVVGACADRGFGSLVYEQPAGALAETRFVATAGKVAGRHDASGWDFFQLKTLLARRCEEVGIVFSSRKVEQVETVEGVAVDLVETGDE